MRRVVVGLALGVGFGAGTSVVNGLSSPYLRFGESLAGTPWAKAAKVLSLLLDAGWSWAALGVLAGWLTGSLLRGALSGVAALAGAVVAYYATDTFVFGAGTDTIRWVVTAVPLGFVLGMVGAAIRSRGLMGLAAALVVPVGAAVQMVVMPPRPHMTVTPSIVVAEIIVWTGAAIGVGWAIKRFVGERRSEEFAAQPAEGREIPQP
ncbi:hypothetical protein ACFYUH_36520 [Streptomyces fimicarius]|uniref:hypothetical protein n=1 Tax=Streptomyces griseus TaxID=1911 RepID=UPI00369C96D1